MEYTIRLLIDELARQESILDSRLSRQSRAKDQGSPGYVLDSKLAKSTQERIDDLTKALDILNKN